MSTCNRLDLQTLGSQPGYAQKSTQSLVHILWFFFIKLGYIL